MKKFIIDALRNFSLRSFVSPQRKHRRFPRKSNAGVARQFEMLEMRVLLAAVNPYVQNPAQDAMTVTWFTQSGTPETLTVSVHGGAQVFSGASTPVLASALAYHANEVPLLPGGIDPGAPYKHSIRVTGLTAGTTYDYTVAQAGGTYASHFRTSPNATSSVRFIVYGDSETEPESTGASVGWTAPSAVPPGSTGRPAGLNNYVVDQTEGYRQNLNLIESRNPDFIGIAGDITESGGEQRDWDELWRHNAGSLNDIASSIPILASPGNHENYGGPGGFGGYTDAAAIRARDKFKTYFETPANGSGVSSFEDRYFRVDYGPLTYISLDVTNGLPAGSSQDTNFFLGAAPGFPDFNPGSTQYEWLEAQLADAQSKSQFTFIQFHHAPYSVGPHGFPAGSGSGFDTQSGVPVRVLTPLFAQYGVDAVFSGHDEQYQHSIVDGIHFYDIGIGGDGLRGPSSGVDGSTGLPSTNQYQQFLAHLDAPEVWNGNQLISGGKHYGHLEVDVYLDIDGVWKAELEPVYNFPLMDSSGNITGWERRVYDDAVMLTAPGILPIGAAINGGSNVNGSGIASFSVNFDKAVTLGSPTVLNLFNHSTGLPVDLSNAVLVGNGTTSVTWVLHDGPGGMTDVVLADGRYTAELPAGATTPSLAQYAYVRVPQARGGH
ncbi:MAG: metallophosphoesterase family protein [Planctomycetaceae bacterium]